MRSNVAKKHCFWLVKVWLSTFTLTSNSAMLAPPLIGMTPKRRQRLLSRLKKHALMSWRMSKGEGKGESIRRAHTIKTIVSISSPDSSKRPHYNISGIPSIFAHRHIDAVTSSLA